MAYEAVVHAAHIVECPDIAEHAKRIQHQHSASLAASTNIPPQKLNLDDNHFAATPNPGVFMPPSPSDYMALPAGMGPGFTAMDPDMAWGTHSLEQVYLPV